MKFCDEEETKMTIYSGFIGMNVDKEKDNLVTAEIGWYVKEKSKNRDNFNTHHFSHSYGSNDSDSDSDN